jgi:hypothetical protein
VCIFKDIKYLIAGLRDPYARFFSASAMNIRLSSVQGKRYGTGVYVRRSFKLRNFSHVLHRVLTTMFKYAQQHRGGDSRDHRSIIRILRCSSVTPASSNALGLKKALYCLKHGIHIACAMIWCTEIASIEPFRGGENLSLTVGDILTVVNGKPTYTMTELSINDLLDRGDQQESIQVKFIKSPSGDEESGSAGGVSNVCITESYEVISRVSIMQPKSVCLDPSSVLRHRGPVVFSIQSFTDESLEEFRSLYWSWRRRCCRDGLIIDLRRNRGGVLHAAVEIAALFLERNTGIIELSDSRSSERHCSLNDGPDTGTPLLILTDRHTASASEVLAEALCSNQRGISVGEVTAGKNVVQVHLLTVDQCLYIPVLLCIYVLSGKYYSLLL